MVLGELRQTTAWTPSPELWVCLVVVNGLNPAWGMGEINLHTVFCKPYHTYRNLPCHLHGGIP